ncbi:MAG: hypothetical protein OIN86_02075 [Candidatus Methanoperedens sp.]|nr:hypothetical protein [Candidatus Methanoperedens sp.]CAG0999045.1 hypothetical protein METP1_02757 [Methanosarcinales archaeon]
MDACNLCHNSPDGRDARNSYGLSYASSGNDFAAIENTDSDGDGWTNLQEIKSLTFPGDANDHPTTIPQMRVNPIIVTDKPHEERI